MKMPLRALGLGLCVSLLGACGTGNQESDSGISTTSLSADGRTFYFNKSALRQPALYFGHPLKFGDHVLGGSETDDAEIRSGNLEVASTDYKLAVCGLKKFGFSLPASQNGVYWGHWT